MEFLKSKVGTGLGIAFICLFGSIYLSISYRVVDNYLSNSYGSGYETIYVAKW